MQVTCCRDVETVICSLVYGVHTAMEEITSFEGVALC